MKLIRDGLWSTTYQNCSAFVKRLNFWEPALAVREAYASRTVYCNGILTPKFLSIKVEQDKHICLQYNYVPMKELSNEDILSNPALLAQLLELLNRLSKIPWEQNDEYWKNNIIKEFEYELSFLNCDTHKYKVLLHSLVPSGFIHGDFSVFNMGLIDEKLIIFDFQHGAYGPSGWDKAYFASTMKKKLLWSIPLTPLETQMAELIAAVRLGRAIKKGLDEIPLRYNIFKSWEKDQ